MKKYYAHIVKWRDSATMRGWRPIDDQQHEVSIITSIGWVIRQTPKTITITAGISECRNVVDALSIPRESVTQITKLKYYVGRKSTEE